MARTLERLSALAVARKTENGLYADGGGLYLQVTGDGADKAKSWLFRYRTNGRGRWMGLGSVHAVSLARARELAAAARALRAEGKDPIDERRDRRASAKAAAARAITFKEAAEAHIRANRASWRNAIHARQWETTLMTYVYPVIGDVPIQMIDTALVVKVLEPIWMTKAETARRVRGRIEAVLAGAMSKIDDRRENPARWARHLENILPGRTRAASVKHHHALPYAQVATFMASLRARGGAAALALELTILTCLRTGEVIGARWGEFDLGANVWTLPAERMKAAKEHRVPLSRAARDVIDRVLAARATHAPPSAEAFIFEGPSTDAHMSNMAMIELLRRMKRRDITVHGFRSTFRDWAAERTAFDDKVVEMALAHTIGNKVEAAYRRGDLFEKRRRVMEEWGEYCTTVRPSGDEKTGQVIAIGASRSS